MEVKKDILWRMYLMYFVLCLFAMLVVFKVFSIQFTSKETMKEKAANLKTMLRTIPSSSGDLYSDNESLLATDIPVYELRMDMKADGLKDDEFYKQIDSLSICLANLFRDKDASAYKSRLTEAKKDGNRFFLVKRKVSHSELIKLKKFPLFRDGKNKSGLIELKENKRSRPFGFLAARTIGYVRIDKDNPALITRVGIEGAYSKYLRGVDGKKLMQRIGNSWKPVSERYEVIPKDGADVYTTIDINLQDVAENALLKQLQEHNAKSGCVILMEVETGYIKAMANLTKDENGGYYEYFNHAIGTAMEPGSTMKLASLLVLFEDRLASPSDKVETGNGSFKYNNQFTMHDTKAHGTITLQEAFEVSSNIGCSRPVYNSYRRNPEKFVNGLKRLGLHQPIGIDLTGEAKPFVKTPDRSDWSGTTLPQMSIGYEIKMTPLQTLVLYNSIANNGKMMKPQFVKYIKRGSRIEKEFEPIVLKEKIVSQRTIDMIRPLLEGVVERGTATKLKSASFKIAGKTGTAQIALEGGGYDKEKYLASFCGYFPADKPKYSCIVVIRETKSGQFYGAEIAAPVFKEIADKIYAKNLQLHDYLNDPFTHGKEAPVVKTTTSKDAQILAAALGIKVKGIDDIGASWVKTIPKGKKVEFKAVDYNEMQVPDVRGMGLKDALYLLENRGMAVIVKGSGEVKQQSLLPGTKTYQGQKIVIELR